MSARLNTTLLNDYLAMVEESESPRLFHIWAAISGVASALGRRCWLDFGDGKLFPNHYVLLVGTPGTRKSTAASAVRSQLKKSTQVRFAPKDTGGQFQGLLAAMAGVKSESEQEQKDGFKPKKTATERVQINQIMQDKMMLSLADIAGISDSEEDLTEEQRGHVADACHMSIIATEFSTFLKRGSEQMVDFLTEMWDGEDYDYKTKATQITLKDPLVNLLGCTTPITLSHVLPPASIGHGFLSRFILVYGAKKHKSVPRPPRYDPLLVGRVRDAFSNIYQNFSGPFTETDAARVYADTLYSQTLDLSDPRFGYYLERRNTHLLKLGMCLAAGRGVMTIERADYEEAHRILKATERGMPDALGEFGANPLSALKQSILEYVRAVATVPINRIHAAFARDATAKDITQSVNDLQAAGQVVALRAKDSPDLYLSAVQSRIDADAETAMLEILLGENNHA